MTQSNDIYRTIDACRLCGGHELEVVLDLGNLCLSDFVRPGEPDPPKVPLRLAYCHTCEFAQLMETASKDHLYRWFWYRSGTTATMRAEMERLANLASVLGKDKPGMSWLDIGANDGTLLSFAPKRVRKIAVEPALNCADECRRHSDLLISNYFAPVVVNEKVDVVFTAAMFYDLDDPHIFIEGVKHVLKDDGIWINQLSSTTLMLEKVAFDNICHEHLGYYTVRTLSRLYDRHGLQILSVAFNETNGGSMCVVARLMKDEVRSRSLDIALEGERDFGYDDYVRFADRAKRWKMSAAADLAARVEGGQTIHVYGASTKGNTLLQYLGAGTHLFDAAAERSPSKYGLVTAGTRIPIISEEDSRAVHPDAYFVLPWAFRREFIAREAQYLANGGRLIFPLPELEEVR